MTNKIQLNILITEQYTLKCSYIDSNNQERVIKLKEDDNEEYIPSLSFINNIIELSQNSNQSINFIEDFFKEPTNFRYYSFSF